MSSDADKLLLYLWLIAVNAVWLITSKNLGILGEPMMLVHGLLILVLTYIPLTAPVWTQALKRKN